MEYDIYGDIAERTGGDVYIGVVGPVRTGKSTFITKFMEEIVLPNMASDKKTVAVDEMPQSASGKTVMTTEPKFVPSQAVKIKVGNKTAKVRLIDCVGYVIKGALGAEENGKERLILTPWQKNAMPFSEAADLGTKKVICDHSTIGIVVTTDGSFTDIPREAYRTREEEIVKELKSINKPFIVIFNTKTPDDKATKRTCAELTESYGVSVIPADVLNIKKQGLEEILGKVLEEFPLRVIDLYIPEWMQILGGESELITKTVSKIKEASKSVFKMKDCRFIEKTFDDSDVFEPVEDTTLDMANGRATLNCKAKNGVFFKALSETAGEEIGNETSLISYVKNLSEAKENYDKIKTALMEAESDGYGIVNASLNGSVIGEPEVVKKSGQYSVKFKVDSKSLHIIRADVSQEVEPCFGSKEQCENFVALMEKEGYNATVFGRSVYEIASEELNKKCMRLPENIRGKLKRVVQKAVNENKSTMICFLL